MQKVAKKGEKVEGLALTFCRILTLKSLKNDDYYFLEKKKIVSKNVQ
jgi:hypothetical protein